VKKKYTIYLLPDHDYKLDIYSYFTSSEFV